MEKDRLLRILHEWNPWWTTGGTAPASSLRRDLFPRLLAGAGEGKIEILAGPRQTGKSTLLRQVLSSLGERDVPWNRLFYLQFDEMADDLEKGRLTLREIFELFSERVAQTPLSRGKKYIFLDEAHLFTGWARALKAFHDQGLPLKFFVSGSAVSSLVREASKVLAGRMRMWRLLPMSFAETIRFRLAGPGRERADAIRDRLQDVFGAFFRNQRPSTTSHALCDIKIEAAPVVSELRSLLARYLEVGGYPEPVVKGLPAPETYALLKTFLTLMIQKDFVDFFHVRDTRTLERLIKMTAQHTGRILVERNLCRDLGVALNTVRNHLGFLMDTGILSSARAYASSFARASRLPEKFFFVDPGLGNALAGFPPDALGPLTETAVFNHLKQFLDGRFPGAEMTYWRKGDDEADIILSLGSAPLPIEVHKGRDSRSAGLQAFGREHQAPARLLVSEKPSLDSGTVSCPPELFLLLG